MKGWYDFPIQTAEKGELNLSVLVPHPHYDVVMSKMGDCSCCEITRTLCTLRTSGFLPPSSAEPLRFPRPHRSSSSKYMSKMGDCRKWGIVEKRAYSRIHA
jgi:hypothetical protein